MGFLKTLFERPDGGFARAKLLSVLGWTLGVAFLVVMGTLTNAQKAAAACCGGLCGSCTVPVYIYYFTTDKTGYTYGDQAILSWSAQGDYCILNGGNWNSAAVSPAGTLGVGLLNPGAYNISLQCVDTGGATTGTSAASWVSFSVCSTGYTWNGSSCQPPGLPTNDITVACGGNNELGCPGGTYNNAGQITKPTSGSKTLSVQSAHYKQSGDTLAAAAIVQLPNNNWSSGSVNPDNYPYAPGSYSNAQVARNDSGIASNSYTFTVTPSTPAGTYYFYPTTATYFYAWNNYASTNANWSRLAYIQVLDAPVQTLPTITVSKSGSPGESATAGTFVVSRTGATTAQLLVYMNMTGTATRCTTSTFGACSTSSTDYYLTGCGISGSASTFYIPVGQSSCTFTLTPVDTVGAEPTETAVMTITSDSAYTLGSPSTQTHNITDNDSSTDICTDISGTQTTPPSGCNSPSPSPGTCIPSGGSYSSGTGTCTSGSGSFSFHLQSSGATITKGTSGSATIQARRTAGSATSIGSFFATFSGGTPAGVTLGTFSPSSCTPSTSWGNCTTLPITVSGSATTGTYQIFVYAYDTVSGTVADYTTLDLVVQNSAQSFSYALSAGNITTSPNNTVYQTVAAELVSGSAQSVTGFFWGAMPSGVSGGAFSPSSCVPTNYSCTSAPLTVESYAEPGTYLISVYGSGGSVSTSFYLTIAGSGGSEGGLTVSITKDTDEGDAGEAGTGQGGGVFILSRTGDPNGNENSLWVDYALDGPARCTAATFESCPSTTDYFLISTCDNVSDEGATIPAGDASCLIGVMPVEDSEEEGTETITITLIPRAGGGND